MQQKVRKRSGKLQAFDKTKIHQAISKALSRTRNDLDSAIVDDYATLAADVVTFKLKQDGTDIIELETIQDYVEEALMDLSLKDVARSYIRYRYDHEKMRKTKSTFMNVRSMVDEYVNKTDWKVNENSNMDYSLQGLNNHIVTEVTKEYWLNAVLSDVEKNAHVNGDIHIHDLGLLSVYCCGWDFEKLLTQGFTGVENKIQSKPPKHFRTALGQLVNFFYTLQGEAAGAQAISSFDTYLAPFVRRDELDYDEVKQAMQEFIFNLNVPTRVGFQTPFVNLTMDLTPSALLRDQPVIIGGERLGALTYGDCQKEMDMINIAFCEIMMEGDASGRIFTFPIPTYNVDETFHWDTPVADTIMKMTAKYGIPYFANFINSDMSKEDARSMCCRLRLDNRVLRKRGGGLFGANPMTGSIGVVTLNLPRIGYQATTKDDVFAAIADKMDIARGILETKRKIIEHNTEDGLYPYSRFYLREIHDRFDAYWKNHFNTIGIIGMNECVMNFYDGQEDITTKKGQLFANEVMDFMRARLLDFQEDGALYNLEATPAEGATYRLASLDKATFEDIITAGEDAPYYTNSTHLPVGFTDDLFEVLDLQDDLQSKYTGGTVLHAYLGESVDDHTQIKKLLKLIFTRYRLPYLSITPTFSVCQEHGYLKGEHFECPHCHRPAEVWTRVVGFYRPVQNYNHGKKEEYRQRKEFVAP